MRTAIVLAMMFVILIFLVGVKVGQLPCRDITLIVISASAPIIFIMAAAILATIAGEVVSVNPVRLNYL